MNGIVRLFFAGAIVALCYVGVENLLQHNGGNTAIGLLCLVCSAHVAFWWIISEKDAL